MLTLTFVFASSGLFILALWTAVRAREGRISPSSAVWLYILGATGGFVVSKMAAGYAHTEAYVVTFAAAGIALLVGGTFTPILFAWEPFAYGPANQLVRTLLTWGVGVLLLAFSMGRYLDQQRAIAQCRAWYAAAASQTERYEVDRRVPVRSFTRRRRGPYRCGDLRVSGIL